MVAVLFVCLGNICRSPAGEGILKRLTKEDASFAEMRIESCGLGGWHVGQLPDSRMRKAALDRDIVLASRAQQFRYEFFDEFDIILAADKDVLNELYQEAKSAHHKSKVRLVTAYSGSYPNQEIPDPYYGSTKDFDLALDMLHDACEGLLEELKKS
ncbi:MAG: low molecular weight protein-tyrosine-phosphatase [Chlamydiota bacterium]|nr:low molecular weight protein-tyrosine-phosphatase [Chlamydiota bacterium]